ncbi:MAG: bifunctional proline dehydrogenase/L-glutamate gamma-semialdehyde dehydrogenase PutA [Pseudomonadota bacterium]|nr:bifunctional proline dehydrogenase/L-glutamate gamma-semialdehyde dehydrogenase PutA [Pseudomonadota bacterium]
MGDPYEDERSALQTVLTADIPANGVRAAARVRALRYIDSVRNADSGLLSAQNVLNSFPLATTEGIALLRLAEALLRAPDAETQTWLIAEKLAHFRDTRIGLDGNFVTRVLSTALKIAGHTAADAELRDAGADRGSLRAWLAKSALRPLVIDGIRRFGDQFVFATNLPDAMARVKRRPDSRVTYSFDMLGEGARTRADADRSYESYVDALTSLKQEGGDDWTSRDGISVKLSAIHPRFETAQIERCERELYPRLVELAQLARSANVNFTVDAEESERLVLHIALFERLMGEPLLGDWPGLGLAMQAYQPRALPAVDHLLRASEALRRPIAVRLVKGAYWDAEIKRAHELGMAGFPVFTRKWATDVSFLAVARRLLSHPAPVYPQFATHNALTVASIIEFARELAAKSGPRRYEFQRLHGMGDPLYDALLADQPDARVRVYAPVGEFRDLLAYLVRRLLENGANTSFVHQITDRSVPSELLVNDVYEQARGYLASDQASSALPTGRELFPGRRNSRGIDLQYAPTLLTMTEAVMRSVPIEAISLIGGSPVRAPSIDVHNPARLGDSVGSVAEATADDAIRAVDAASASMRDWDAIGVDARAAIIDRVADAWEAAHDELAALIVREAGRTMLDAHLEVREAIDFCRYYAALGRTQMKMDPLPGPAGESNELRLAGRGVFVCISPWNFPLAIFGGQIAAALVAGNSVVAKPAEQTPLIAFRAVQLMHDAGVPPDALHLTLGRGETVGRALTSDPRIAGVAFTGSIATARAINRALAARDSPIGVLIAETGGQNAMIVDSTALPEQVTDAVVSSAFRSCGQRCSALRVLFVQRDVADAMTAMIAGALRELIVGDPADPRTDIGPVIDAEQLALLQQHRDWLRTHGRRIYECELPSGLKGHFFAPIAYEIDAIGNLESENFGPILHVIRYAKHDLDKVIDAINTTGYGLTMGLHTRLDARVEHVTQRARVGNLYVNRNIIGAVVGSQPFGGEGLSGTGPKAGGPRYLQRFCAERAVTINTAAAGGNVELTAGLAS